MKKGIRVEKKGKRSSISTKLSMILGIASVLVFFAMSVAIIKTGEGSIRLLWPSEIYNRSFPVWNPFP